MAMVDVNCAGCGNHLESMLVPPLETLCPRCRPKDSDVDVLIRILAELRALRAALEPRYVVDPPTDGNHNVLTEFTAEEREEMRKRDRDRAAIRRVLDEEDDTPEAP